MYRPKWQFATTSWTQLLAARDSGSPESRQALEGLCQAYWYPVYALIRRQGPGPEDSRDLTQAYFAELLAKDFLDDYDPSLGRFRVFLKASVKHFLSKERQKAEAWKRGGRVVTVSLDAEELAGRERSLPGAGQTPEEAYERSWASTVLEHALARLRHEFESEGRAEEFALLKDFLTGDEPKVPYREVAAALTTTEAGVKKSVQRLRQRFGSLLRQEIAQTVASSEEVDDEVRYLLTVVAPWGPTSGS